MMLIRRSRSATTLIYLFLEWVALNLKEINQSISESENIPEGKVRRVTKALLMQFEQAIDKGETLRLPGLTFFLELNQP